MIDITSIGAGGGSIAAVDRAGLLTVGPASAGAEPGPACYGRGGTEPTVTDANLVLGYLGTRFLGHANGQGRTLDLGAARRALEGVAQRLQLSIDDAAEAIITIANVRMASAIRLVSVARGFDPREFVLVTFGGAGPLHAVELMREIGIAATLVPALPGVTSALGCVIADVRRDFVHALHAQLDAVDEDEIAEAFRIHNVLGVEFLREQAATVTDVVVDHRADIGYEGQTHIVSIPLPSAAPSRKAIQASFEAEYVRRYGQALHDHPMRIVNLRTAVIGRRARPDLRSLAPRGGASLAAACRGSRRARFGSQTVDTPVYERGLLPQGLRVEGPAIVEQADTTTVIPPDAWGVTDSWGNLIIRLRG
jgi:N-methylhydantoinase A